MKIGVDFDNTIICYDNVFSTIARTLGLFTSTETVTKTALRDRLRSEGQEEKWIELQGYVYGVGLKTAEPFPGVKDFFQACRERGIETFVVSHKTRHPYRGKKYDLHAAARDWLEQQGFVGDGGFLPGNAVFLEVTKEAKISRIDNLHCTHFIDDLPEFLSESSFPKNVKKLLFDPDKRYLIADYPERFTSWFEMRELLFP